MNETSRRAGQVALSHLCKKRKTLVLIKTLHLQTCFISRKSAKPIHYLFSPTELCLCIIFSTFQFVKIVAGWFIKGTTQSLCAAFEINKRFRCLLLCDSLFKRQTNRSVYFPIFARHSLKCDIFLAKRMRPQFVWALLCTSLQLVRQIRRFNLNVSQFTFFFPHVRIFPFNFG